DREHPPRAKEQVVDLAPPIAIAPEQGPLIAEDLAWFGSHPQLACRSHRSGSAPQGASKSNGWRLPWTGRPGRLGPSRAAGMRPGPAAGPGSWRELARSLRKPRRAAAGLRPGAKHRPYTAHPPPETGRPARPRPPRTVLR